MSLRDGYPDDRDREYGTGRTAVPPALSWESVEQRLWEDPFRCGNIECCDELGRDHVTLITATRMRRFCSVDCITAGQHADRLAIEQHERLRGRLAFDALEDGDEPTANHLRDRDEQAALWQRALSLHRHQCEPESAATDVRSVRDEEALSDAARHCARCMIDASRGFGFSVR